MHLLPGNPSSHAVEAYRDSGEARCPKCMRHLPTPFSLRRKGSNRKKRAPLGATSMAWMALVCVEELDTRSRVQFSTSWDQFHSYGTHV